MPAGIGFIVPPNPAMYDEERAEEERHTIECRAEERRVRLTELDAAIEADQDLHATYEGFEKVAAPVRRQMISTDRERLPDIAADWETALGPRFRVLSDELEQIERHRAMLIERLQGMIKHALGRLRAAQRASRFPDDLGDWSGLEFLRIAFTPPDDAISTESYSNSGLTCITPGSPSQWDTA